MARAVGARVLTIEDQMAKLGAEVLAGLVGRPCLGPGWICRWRKGRRRETDDQRKEEQHETEQKQLLKQVHHHSDQKSC